jgi:hypothetical protein
MSAGIECHETKIRERKGLLLQIPRVNLEGGIDVVF